MNTAFVMDDTNMDEVAAMGRLSLKRRASTRSRSRSRTRKKTRKNDENMDPQEPEIDTIICQVCCELVNKYNQSILCCVECYKCYHKRCISASKAKPRGAHSDSTFLCNDCSSGSQSLCFICGQIPNLEDEEKLLFCAEEGCIQVYHESCLDKRYPFDYKLHVLKDGNHSDEGKLRCPLHYCLSCYQANYRSIENQDSRLIGHPSKILKCIKCPTAYHFDDKCLAAGTVLLRDDTMLCPNHIDPSLRKARYSYCFACCQGGELICCENCPAAYHQECIPLEEAKKLSKGGILCPTCHNREQLNYGEFVWVLLGRYRCWPAIIPSLDEVPENILAMDSKNGHFPVYYFGSHDYSWVHRGQVFKFMWEDIEKWQSKGTSRGGRSSGKSLDAKFEKAMEEIREEWLKRNPDPDPVPQSSSPSSSSSSSSESRAILAKKNVSQYVKIKENDYTMAPFAIKTVRISEDPCNCDPKGPFPCSDEDCLNRALMYECNENRCKANERCHNRRFDKQEWVTSLQVRGHGTVAGCGLFTLEPIEKGRFVIEYVGEVIGRKEYERRLQEMRDKHEKNFYFLFVTKDAIIDARHKGNMARFVNHSCDPNCELQKWTVNGEIRMGLFALTTIEAGSELTFDYNFNNHKESNPLKCSCKSNKCKGFLGSSLNTKGKTPNKSQ